MRYSEVLDSIIDMSVSCPFPEEILIPGTLKTIIGKALEKNPDSRYQTTQEMLKDLQGYR
jgi:serine/threonine protein kinase